MASREEAARQIFGERAAWYTTSTIHNDPQVLARLVELAQPQPDWTGLDIATGTGHTAFAVAPHVASVIGIDLTPEMLAEAEQLGADYGTTNAAFRIADAHELPFPDASFDLVTCRRAAHHFSDIGKAIAEMRRVLRPGGRLLVDDRSAPEDDWGDWCINELDIYHDESHVREYRPSEWARMLAEAGFAVDAVEPYVKHRAVSSHTGKMSPEGRAKTMALLATFDERQREVFNLVEVNGELHFNHWYVLVAATR